jgi:hypothetical protein
MNNKITDKKGIKKSSYPKEVKKQLSDLELIVVISMEKKGLIQFV